MKRKIIVLILITIFIYFILNCFFNLKETKIKELLLFGLWNGDEILEENENQNIFFLDARKNNSIKIDIKKTIKGEGEMYKKIAPGTKGEFILRLKKDDDIKCKIIITDITKKPMNLEFSFNGNTYNSLKDIQKELNNIINEKNEIIIDWYWKYSTADEADIQDTKDGQNAMEYVFRVDTYVEN